MKFVCHFQLNVDKQMLYSGTSYRRHKVSCKTCFFLVLSVTDTYVKFNTQFFHDEFNFLINAPTCFGLHSCPSSWNT